MVIGVIVFLAFDKREYNIKKKEEECSYSRYGCYLPDWMGDKNIAQSKFKKGDRFVYIDVALYGMQGTITDESILRTNDTGYGVIIDSYGPYFVRQSQIIRIPPQYEINLHFSTKPEKTTTKKKKK